MKKLGILSALLILFVGTSLQAQNDKDQKIIADAEVAMKAMIAEDQGLENFFSESAGYVIFPNVGKGGLIVGGASGNGVVYENGSVVGMADLKKLDIGLQAGGQAISEVIFFEDEAALADFKQGEFEFSAQASAVVVKSGKAENAQYKDGVAVFAMPKAGLMAEAAVGGQKFSFKPIQ